MREEYREILEDAVMDSMGGEDFDEMLLRAAKKHLPLKYNKHFSAMLDEVLAEAGNKGITNRQAAQALLRNLKAPEAQAPRPVKLPEALPVPSSPATTAYIREVPVVQPAAPRPGGVTTQPHAQPPRLPQPPRPEKAPAPGAPPPTKGLERDECVKEMPKILDLAGAHPETLPPEVKDKLTKLVKVQKKKAEWSEGPEEGPDPTMFFKGSQRVPPVVHSVEPAAEDGPVKKKKIKQLKKD